jgi:hypothetical protein
VKAGSVDAVIAEIAVRQHAVVSRKQLLATGASGAAIQHRISIQRLHPVHAGVYAVGQASLTLDGRYMAAVLACGEDAILSHRSAAALLGIQRVPSGPIDVTVRHRGGRGRAGVAIHVTRSLDPAEISVCRGIPCTSVARTLLDLAALVTPAALERALEQAQILRLFDHAAVQALLAKARGRPGAGSFRLALANLADEPKPVRSELERRFLELVRRIGVPAPVVNGVLAGYEVDFHWPVQRLVVETDGRSTHATRYGFERDRQRDLDLELAGWHVVRISWRQLAGRPELVSAMLRRRLASRDAA